MQKLSLLIYLVILANISYSQQDITLRNILPPSPEATAFVKSGMYPIGTYTGKPDITVPIYEIKTANLSVPISLSYDATGIRVNDVATWAGMNWSLNAGGMISQLIVGEPDKMSTSIYDVPPRASEIINNTTYFNYFKAFVDRDIYPGYADGEPDKFFYSLPNGKSGSFVLDRNRNIMQIPKTSLKISVIGSLSGFNVTDESGTTYVFSILENTESFIYNASGQYADAKSNPTSSTYRNQTTGYYLSEIISSDGNDHIYFTYENETVSSNDDSYTETWGNKYPGPGEPQFPYANYHEYRWNGTTRVNLTPRLKIITFSNGKVEFARVAGRLDDGSSSRLDEITIYSKSSVGTYLKLKSFKFIHGYYYNSDVYASNSGFPQNQNTVRDRYRLRLDSIKLKDAIGKEMSGYTFSYNSTNPPPKTSCAQDWYGYYNGVTSNTTLVRPTTVFNGVNNVTIGGADRSSNEGYMKAGILEKVTYPTGGYTVFDLESHKLYNAYSWVGEGYSAYAQGNTSNNLIVQTFTVPTSIQSGSGKFNLSIGPYSSGYPQPFVKIKNMSTGQELTFTSPDMTQWYSYNQSYDFQPGITYQLTASCYVNQSYAIANISASFTKSVYDPHLDPIGGLRIKSIKNYNSDNTFAYEENYKYGPNENGSGVLTGIGGPNSFSYGRDQHIFHISQCGLSGGIYGVFMGGPLYDQCLTQGSPVVYTDVAKYYGTPTSNAGKTLYNYGFESQQSITTGPLPSGQELANNQGILIINDSWKRGHLKKQYEFRKNPDGSTPLYTLLNEVENIYETTTTDQTYGLFAQAKWDRILLLGNEQYCGETKFFTDYAYAEYPVNTGYVQLTQTIKKEYDPNGSSYVQTTINHTYDATRKDIEIKTATVNSRGVTIESEKKFPFHKSSLLTSITPAESTTLDDMVSKNMLFPIEEIQRNNGTQTMLKKTSYEYVNASTIAPVNIKYQIKSNPIETRLQFTKYDANGNLTEQSKTNDITKTYVWGYNKMYPVAEVVGASYTQVMNVLNSSVIDNPSDDVSLRTELNKIRSSFPSAQVATNTYKPLVGMTSQTDANGRTVYYVYDSFGRLALVKDKDGKILKKYCYNFLGQPGNCSIYGNAIKTGTYTKVCPSGQTGSQVTYTVPANTYYASTQVEADALAQNDINANGLTYANNNGTCNLSCSISFSSGYYDIAKGISADGTTVSFYLAFYSYSTMSSGIPYVIGTINGGCKPSSDRTFTFSSGGRTWVLVVSPSGQLTLNMAYGSPLDPYTAIGTPTFYFNL